MKYVAEVSPRSLSTVKDPLKGYPEIWELLWWYKCARKYPYPSEVIAALMVETRDDAYHHYLCPETRMHWHIGKGHGHTPIRHLIGSAKRRYRKAVRDEIWAEYEEKARVVDQAKESRSAGN